MVRFINSKITIIYAMFTISSVLLVIVTHSFLSFMLGINVFLAYIPMFLLWYLNDLQKAVNYKYMLKKSYLIFIIFVLFFPNTFYIITDFIHISSNQFYTFNNQYTPVVYSHDIIAYIMVFHIFLASLFGVFAGVYSLAKIKELMINQKLSKKLSELIIISIIFLSSVGIYIGRFLRFFSWEIFAPFRILTELIDDFSWFMVLFVLIFSVLQYGLYLTKDLIKIS